MKRLLTALTIWLLLAAPAFAQGGNSYARWQFLDDFIGGGSFGLSAAQNDPWVITDTSSAGTPTYVRVDHGESTGTYANGVAKITMASDIEAENVCLSFGNKLCFDIDTLYGCEFRIRFVGQTGSAKDAATQLAFGLCSDRNDDPDSIVAHASFRLAAASTSMALTVESDDGTNDNDDVATSVTVTDSAWYRYRILFTSGTSDVRFYAINANSNPSASFARMAGATTFDMDGYTAGLQPYVQLWKSSDSNTDSVEVEFADIWGRR